jgi:hypothetical protein
MPAAPARQHFDQDRGRLADQESGKCPQYQEWGGGAESSTCKHPNQHWTQQKYPRTMILGNCNARVEQRYPAKPLLVHFMMPFASMCILYMV